MSEKILKHITVDQQNYRILKELGSAGESFNDVLSRLLKKSTTQDSRENEESTAE